MDSWNRVVVALGLALLTLAGGGCNSSGGGAGSLITPVDVSGVWEAQTNNAGSAVLRSCTGDFAALEGLTVAGVTAAAPSCTNPGPGVVTQSGGSFTILSRSTSCSDGSTLTLAGGGTVTGSSLSGQFDTISLTGGWTRIEFFTGSAGEDVILLSENRISVNGSVQGACNIVPALSLTVSRLAAPTGQESLVPGFPLGSLTAIQE